MPGDSLSTANYSAVIKDLRAKRAEIDRAIALLETIAPADADSARGEPANAQPVEPAVMGGEEPIRSAKKPRRAPPAVNGLGEACVRILREAKRSLSTREVTTLVEQSGFQLSTKNPINNVWSALNYLAKLDREVARNGKLWRFVPTFEKGATTASAEMNG